MSTRQQAPYGSWRSPLQARQVAQASRRPGEPWVTAHGIFWHEARPDEQGRIAILRASDDGVIDTVLPPPYSARTRAHEYGGGAYTSDGRRLWFVAAQDQAVHQLDLVDGSVRQISPAGLNRHYADLRWDARRQRLLCISEDLRTDTHEPVAQLVVLRSNELQVLAQGHDFYASPTLSLDGGQLAYLNWNHPNMPWDGTQLWLAQLDAQGAIEDTQHIAGGASESIFQPEFGPDGALYFVSDRSGWWNLYRWQDGRLDALLPMAAEFGLPQWQFNMRAYAILADGRLLCSYAQQGRRHLGWLHPQAGRLHTLELPYTDFMGISACGMQAAFIAASPRQAPAVYRFDGRSGRIQALTTAATVLDDADLSVCQLWSCPTESGELHGLWYEPQNPQWQGPLGQRPPLLLRCHGGPTSCASPTQDLRVQYWTSRGFAVLDLNYHGSTGYGRAYREALYGYWGEADVADCVAAARALGRDLIDPAHCAITGSSAGGYTVLCSLGWGEGVFCAGASYYGISDLELLARDTHKFESHYLEHLIGPYPQMCDVYRARSPIHRLSHWCSPVIFLQGLEDKVVPPNQARRMVRALRKQGQRVSYLSFPQEGHGFRSAPSIIRALRAELRFYGQIMGFDAQP